MKYYVYALIDPRNKKPFYIGKGSGSRASDTKTDMHNPLKRAVLETLEHLKKEPVVKILHDDLTETEAYDLEIQEIRSTGRILFEGGPLTNIRLGGDTHRIRNKDAVALKLDGLCFSKKHAETLKQRLLTTTPKKGSIHIKIEVKNRLTGHCRKTGHFVGIVVERLIENWLDGKLSGSMDDSIRRE